MTRKGGIARKTKWITEPDRVESPSIDPTCVLPTDSSSGWSGDRVELDFRRRWVGKTHEPYATNGGDERTIETEAGERKQD